MTPRDATRTAMHDWFEAPPPPPATSNAAAVRLLLSRTPEEPGPLHFGPPPTVRRELTNDDLVAQFSSDCSEETAECLR